MKSKPVLPVITIEPLDHSLSAVRLTCCPITLNPIHPGVRMKANLFEAESGRHLLTLTLRSYGPILFENNEVVEVHRVLESDSRVLRRETHWLGVTDDMIQLRLRDLEETDSSGARKVDLIEMSFPSTLTTAYTSARTVRYIHGDCCATENYIDSVTGVFTVTIGESIQQCLKLATVSEGNAPKRVETYIDIVTGMVVYTEIFDRDRREAVQIISIENQDS